MNDSKFSSIANHRRSQFVLEIAIMVLIIKVIIISIKNGLRNIIKT